VAVRYSVHNSRVNCTGLVWPFADSRTVSVRSCRYSALRQSGKHRRTASRSGAGALPAQEHRPVLAVDNASVRLARSHVHTGFTERLPRTDVRFGPKTPIAISAEGSVRCAACGIPGRGGRTRPSRRRRTDELQEVKAVVPPRHDTEACSRTWRLWSRRCERRALLPS